MWAMRTSSAKPSTAPVANRAVLHGRAVVAAFASSYARHRSCVRRGGAGVRKTGYTRNSWWWRAERECRLERCEAWGHRGRMLERSRRAR